MEGCSADRQYFPEWQRGHVGLDELAHLVGANPDEIRDAPPAWPRTGVPTAGQLLRRAAVRQAVSMMRQVDPEAPLTVETVTGATRSLMAVRCGAESLAKKMALWVDEEDVEPVLASL